LADYTQVIEGFRTAALTKMKDEEFMKKVSEDRITKLFESDELFLFLKEKIEETITENRTFVEQVRYIRQNKDEFDFNEDELKQMKEHTKSNAVLENTHLFLMCEQHEAEFADEFYKKWLELRHLKFGRTVRHPFQSWKSFCRLCILEHDKVNYMSSRIWYIFSLYLKNNKNAYFQFIDHQLGETKAEFPKNFPRIELLKRKSSEFFHLYKILLDNVSFDAQTKGTNLAKPKGRIDWKRTIMTQARGETLSFVTKQNIRNFVTPENELILVGAQLIYLKADELLKTALSASESEKTDLAQIKIKASRCFSQFPFPNVQLSVRNKRLVENFEVEIPYLLSDVKTRLLAKKINNNAYKKLHRWTDEFLKEKGLHRLMGVAQHDSLVFLSLRDIDAMYEIWILFELLHHLHRSGKSPVYDIKKEGKDKGLVKKITFDWEGKDLEVYYDEKLSPKESIADDGNYDPAEPIEVDIFTESTPDFFFKLDGKNVAVFDAKNYSDDPLAKGVAKAKDNSSGRGVGRHKVMGYMTNLDCNLGVVIWPYKAWEQPWQVNKSGKAFLSLYFDPIPEQENEHSEKIKQLLDALKWSLSQ
tara:strand:- start:11937 stop:13697 length:1761 start_codon:yes stop_codon:yes gene_type:complete